MKKPFHYTLKQEENFLFYDGNCEFCKRCISFLRKRSPSLSYYPLQSTFAKKIFLEKFSTTPDLTAISLWKNQKIYYASDALLQSLSFSKGFWKIFAFLCLKVPLFLRNKVYFFTAKRRNYFCLKKQY